MGAHDYRGVIVLDATDPLQPRVQSELTLAGEVRQLQLDPGRAVSLVIDEIPVLREATVPPPASLSPVTRLVRYEAGDPSGVRRVADVALEGEFWRMVERGATRWVMSAAVAEPLLSCKRSPASCGYVTRTGLIITGYRFQQAEWQVTQRIELPMNTQAWATPEGFASFELMGPRDGDGGALHFVRFLSDDELGAPGSLMLPRSPVDGAPLSLAAGQARLFLRDFVDGSVQLVSFDSTTGSQLSFVAGLQQGLREGTNFTADAVYVGDEGLRQQALLVDLRDATIPVVTPFPQPVARALPLDEAGAVLGVGQQGDQLAFTLMRVEMGAVTVLDMLSIDVGGETPSVWREADRVLFSYRAADRSLRTGAIVTTDTQIAVLGPAATGYADEVIGLDDVLYAPDAYGLNVAALADKSSTRLTWTEDVRAFVMAGDYEAALVTRLGMPPRLELVRGDQRHEFDASPGADRLLADGDRLLVLSTETHSACEQSGLDCTDYAPNVAIFSLGDTPGLVAEVPLAAVELSASGDDWRAELDWQRGGASLPLALGGGRYVFTAELDASCLSQASCDALGIEARPIAEANIALSMRAPCPPGTSVGCRADEPAPMPTVYGMKRAQRFYLLDASAASPRLGPALESVLELNDSRFAPLRLSQGTVLAARLERNLEPGISQPSQSARYMLDRIRLNADGQLEKLAPINTPGYPIAMLPGGAGLIAAEPSADAGEPAMLHRLQLDGDRARIVQSEPLEARFGEITEAFASAFYLRHEGSGCEGSTTIEQIALGDGDDGLRILPGLQLPGASWKIADHADGRLLLTSQSMSYAVVEVGQNGALRLERFLNEARYLLEPTLHGRSVVGAGGLSGRNRVDY